MGNPGLAFGPRPPRALYVHFPFCVHRCHYCDFSVTRTSSPPRAAWLGALSAEIAWWFENARWERPAPLDTLFVGGGTPSLLGADGMPELRSLLERWFDLDGPELEWTVEANPSSFDEAVARGWLDAGVNRVSLGVQSFDDGALEWLGRRHDAAGAREAIAAARGAGLTKLNIDLLFGLPAGVSRDLDRDLETALDAGVTHVSAYGLTIESRTPLARWVRQGRIRPVSEATYAREYRAVAARLVRAGFEHYEVSNFARPGHQARHNWYYWNRLPYLGTGPSAHGFLPPFRVWNVFRWDRYRAAVTGGAGPIEGRERLSAEDEALERVWLDLRTNRGLDARDPTGSGAAGALIAGWKRAGWLRTCDGRIEATVEGWLRLDELAAGIAGAVARDAPG